MVEEGDANDLNASALALGGMTKGTTTLEMASAFSTFPNNGVRYDTSSFTKVVDKQGNVILENKPKEHKVLDEGVAWIMADMLSSVVNSAAANYAQISGVFVGGKTGTTNRNSDAWFIGFTPQLVSGCWVGGDDRDIHFDSTTMGQGATMALPIWAYFMKKVYADKALGYDINATFDLPANFDPCYNSEQGYDEFGIDEVYE